MVVGLRRSSLLSFTSLQVLLVFLAYIVVRPLTRLGSRLEEASYFSSFLSPTLFSQPIFVFLGLGVLAACVLFPGRTTWRSLDSSFSTRWFVWMVAAIFAWTCSTYGYNFYYNQTHLWDRLLVLVLCGLIWLHPFFVLPFTFLVLAIFQQALHPLPWASWIWPDKRLPLDFLSLFNSFLLVQTFLPRKRHLLALVTLVLTGMMYFHAAVSKLALQPPFGWVLENSLSNLLVSSYKVGGWLGFLTEDRLISLARAMGWLDRPLAILTLAVEASGILLLVSRPLCRFCLLCFVTMHVGILMSSGIFFWKWIIFDLALLWYVSRIDERGRKSRPDRDLESHSARESQNRQLFGRDSLLSSVLAIVLLRPFFGPVPFAWWDSNFMNYARIEGVGVSGRRYLLDARFFSIYDILIQQSRFYYLVRDPVIVDTYGTVHKYELVQALKSAKPETIPRIRSRFGNLQFDRSLSETFGHYLTVYVQNALDGGPQEFLLNRLSAPHHFQTYVPGSAFRFQERLRDLQVEFVEYLFTGNEISEIGREKVLTISLEAK